MEGSTKMKITEITIDPTTTIPGDPLRFRVGDSVIEGGHVVEKITYNPICNAFNKGLEIGVPCYAVFFDGIPERRLVVERVVTSVEVVKEASKKVTVNPESSVELPE